MDRDTIRTLRREQGITQQELALKLGVTQQAIAKWEKGVSTPEPSMLKKIAAYFDVTVDHLLGVVIQKKEVKGALQYTPPARVRVIGAVKAGYGMYATAEDLGTEAADVRNPEDYFFLVVQGDSMEPLIHDGDLALVHRQSTLDDGDLGVIIYGNEEATLKVFEQSKNSVRLRPFNESYDEVVIEGSDREYIHIIGKVIETKTKW